MNERTAARQSPDDDIQETANGDAEYEGRNRPENDKLDRQCCEISVEKGAGRGLNTSRPAPVRLDKAESNSTFRRRSFHHRNRKKGL